MTAAVEVEAPAIVDGLPADEYHADRTSISSSGLRALLKPGCPAQFKYDREHPVAPKREFDLGNAVHAEVLGEGHDIVEITEFSDYKKADARALRDEAYAAGKVPLLPKEKAQVDAMAEAIRSHPVAGPLFAPGTGVAERSIYWTDPATGVRCRVRPDWLKQLPELTLCVDLKTIRDAAPDTISRAIRDHNYHQQDPFYIDGIYAALKPETVRFIFVFVSKQAPYLITVRELHDQDRDIGRARNEKALRIYADCVANDHWPDWTGPITEIPQIGMPTWDTIRQAEEYLGE
ncbi:MULTISPECIES: PD-(D/E)XK nuclease-like domain-containing protein [unclassified Streptomyces]|uniref:PD-(D/E)XK nuclease-like domain-containing protein n=1 Tax=unclassified Streptomyces TaxID=2593676 RepID=UPI00278C085C|nr:MULTISPECIES: PD-(D/E)XK nuclease-like domain-containing protein [unclassified Streptomyces]